MERRSGIADLRMKFALVMPGAGIHTVWCSCIKPNTTHLISLSIQPGIQGLEDQEAEQFTEKILHPCFVSAGDFTQSVCLAIFGYCGYFLLLPD